MQLAFRWFGPDDPVPLAHIRQIPKLTTIVSAIYDVPVGAAWPRARAEQLAAQVDQAGLQLGVIESIPVHEDIKLGRPARDRWTANWCESLLALRGLCDVVCYNWMPVFDWARTDLDHCLPDGSSTLAFDQAQLSLVADLPGWATAYTARELAALRHAYESVDAERLWENLAWFLERVVPAAEELGLKLALHPDDPPWPIFGLPRIITDGAALERLLALHDSPAHGLTFCSGSLGADPHNDLPAMIRRFGERIHFAHCRNVRVTGERSFYETAHAEGDLDLVEVMRAYHEVGFSGPMRPDHGRMIWGETGRPGYGLYDRALGAMYLEGLWQAITRQPAESRL